MARKKGLTHRQRQLFNHMTRHGGTVWETADHLRIREHTMRRWMKNTDFVAEWRRVIQLIKLIARTDALQHHRAAGTSPGQPATTPTPTTTPGAPAPGDDTPPPNPAPDRAPRKTRPDRDPGDDESDTPSITEREWLLQTQGPEVAARFDTIFGLTPPAPAPADADHSADAADRHPGEVIP